jgi:uncharacterized protein (DUF952 family)
VAGFSTLLIVYKICPASLWQEAEKAGRFEGSPVDRVDGFIHFSTGEQVPETFARHFAGLADLVLVAVDAERLGHALRWEPSRGGELFPHLHGPLLTSAVLSVRSILLAPDGLPALPELD